MTIVTDLIAKRNDNSQILDYDNPQFPCIAFHSIYLKNQYYLVTDHWHEELEFIYVKEGELEFSINGTKLTLHAGEGIFVNARRIHSNHTASEKSCDFYCILVHPSLFCSSKYIEQTYFAPICNHDSFDYLLLTQKDWTSEIISIFLHMMESSDQETIELEMIESFYKILRLIFKNVDLDLSVSQIASANNTAFLEMITFIQNHYMEKISLQDIADAGNVGKTLCAKLFKKYVSKTPGDYLIYYRVQKSLDYLVDSDVSITEISYNTGFSSASHYTKTFHEVMNCTPLKYRNEHMNLEPIQKKIAVYHE